MNISEIMTRSVYTVRPETTVRDAADLLARQGITSLPVLDDVERVIGLVSEADLIKHRFPPDPRSHLRPAELPTDDPPTRVGDVMTTTVVCLPETADAADAAETMLASDVRAIPVVDGSHLVGIVSRRDLLRTLTRADDAIAAEVTARLMAYRGTTMPWRIHVENGIVTITGRMRSDTEQHVVTALTRTVPGVLRVHLHATRIGAVLA
jgi:CBS domain-containing protein